MELRTLHYFLAVAREENMTEAANVLHVTQPTLSRQMADLEAELGKKLFTRTNRSTVLTEEGVHLRQRAEEILSLVDQTEEEIRDDNTDLSGNIRIGAGITHLIHYLTETFAELRRDNPRLTIELWTGNADTIQEKLEHGLLDFALFIEPFHAEKYEYLRLPGKNKLGVVTSAHGPWADAGKVTPEMITQMPLMVSSRHTNRSFDLVTWSQGKVTPEKLTIVGTMDLSCNVNVLVRQGITNLLCLDKLEHQQSPDFVFLPLDPPFEVSSLVAWKKYRLLSRSCEAFLEALRARVGEEQ
ncbi:LysR family transcriptional regulator [Megasphaera elsdenii]|uniref:LysR family transcriptional regulator n=1 Tax=Megasphaera elsdenii TaxID=907 RepID=UPI00242A904D|nr:LysR family transcriptional regulator [Megasphaera elsdenii]MCI6192567.1 LysR family transcriptional regulator [Megasphaera elsdenii]